MLVRLGVLAALTASAACMTASDGEALRKDVDALKRQFGEDVRKAQEGQKQLKRVLEQATGLLARNSADVGAQVERLQARLASLGGTLEEVQKAFNDLNQKYTEWRGKVDVKLEALSSGAPQPQAPVPQDKDTLFRDGERMINGGKHEEGRRFMRHFLGKHGSDGRAASAQRLLGDSYFAEGQFAKAVQEYRQVIFNKAYKRSPVVGDALYKVGLSLYQLKHCGDASLFFKEFVRRYRSHGEVSNAKKFLGLIQRNKRNRQFCSS